MQISIPYLTITGALLVTVFLYILAGELIHALLAFCEAGAYAALSRHPVAPRSHSNESEHATAEAQEGDKPPGSDS